MPEIISKNEKFDLLLALSIFFEGGQANDGLKAAEIFEGFSEKAAGYLSDQEVFLLRERAGNFDQLSEENKRLRQKQWLDKISRRGRSTRLDELVHPSQIVKVLKSEPKNIQSLIIRNLRIDSQLQIAAELKIKFPQNQNAPVREDILSIVRQNFLRCFVTLEDVFEPIESDRFSHSRLSSFTLWLGIRETAIACRGIKSKESLAVFLNRFDKRDAHEIARFITEMAKIKPFWVVQADRAMQNVWRENLKPHDFLTTFGLKLLALAYSDRDAAAQKFAAQKMSVAESEKWAEFLSESEREFENASAEERENIDKRRQIIKRLAISFERTENL